jgi:hypothetical protein
MGLGWSGYLYTVAMLAGCVVLGGCSVDSGPRDAPVVVKKVAGERAPVKVFPDAATAIAYTGIGLTFGPDGKAMVSPNFVHPNATPTLVPAPAYDTAALSLAEMQTLQASVYYGPTPKYSGFDTCSDYRFGDFSFKDGFAFYNSAGRYLGNLVVCSENMPAVMTPAPINQSGLPMMRYDATAVQKIMSAHELSAAVFADDIEAGTQRLRAPIFPKATHVEAYAAQGLAVTDDGRVLMGRIYPGIETRFLKPVLPQNSAALTQAEIKDVQNSVYFTQLPEWASECVCEFNHAFTFFDSSGNYLGYVAMCFRCGCLQISPKLTDKTMLPAVSWDGKVLYGIFTAHHLKP